MRLHIRRGTGVINADRVSKAVDAVTGEVAGKTGGQSVTLTEHEHPSAPEGAPSAPTPGT